MQNDAIPTTTILLLILMCAVLAFIRWCKAPFTRRLLAPGDDGYTSLALYRGAITNCADQTPTNKLRARI